ncbi:MAG: flagellar hook-associated protein FlgK [Chitinivibrionales bacterium]|nr:flagellar hook-associated protein FlgK [Chitinivibrionales bacterium]MBD3396540.1 flagellar hook-associated protein FlgK [Chitinivibrionales bacterium]
MGLFSVLGIGTRGLATSQIGMEVSGQNISNADVDGYSRKRINVTAAYRMDEQFGQMGYGVEVIDIERMRDVYIDEQIRRQNHEVGFFEEVDQTLQRIENIFLEPSDSGLLHFIGEFFDSWHNLSNNPADEAARTVVKTNGEILADVFHNLMGEMRDLQTTRNNEIEALVERVNEIAEEIHHLNMEISTVETRGQHANDSRDRRDQLLKELAKIIDIDTTENDLGQITVTTMGNIIVSPVGTQKLELSTTTFQRPDGTSGSNVGIRFAESKTPYYPLAGQIKGLIDSRDVVIPYYMEQLDSLAVSLAERVNELHVTGFNLLGYTGLEFFDSTMTGASDMAVAPAILSNVRNIAAAQGGEVRGHSETINHTFGNPAIPLTYRNLMSGSVVVTNIASSSVLQEGVDYNIDYTRGTFQLLNGTHSAQNLQIQYQYNTGAYAGPGNNANSVAIAELRHEFTMVPDALGNNTATFDQFYSSFIAKLGLDRDEAASSLETREFLVEQYQTEQDSIAGVSLDEEMADIIKFQHTYQAAARLITTASTMMETLINM